MNDSSDVLALLAAAVPTGPRDHELMTLHDLARYVAIRFDMPETGAGRTVVAALLGDDHWKGKAPESLPVYLRLTTGPRALFDQWTEWQGEKDPPPERWQSLRHLALGLTFGCCTINEVPEGRNYDHHAGRFLSVVKADAWHAFGLTARAPAPAAVQSDPTPAPTADPTAANQQQSGPDLEHIAAVYLREVRIGQHGAITRAAAKLKRLDGEPMGRTTLVKRLKEASEAGIHTGYPPER